MAGFYNRDGVCLLRGTDWIFIYNCTFCLHSVFMCFVWIWEQTAIISLYSINCLVFITETECLLRGTDWIFIYNSTFCPHSVFMCFVWIWEQTATCATYTINCLVFITETECLLHGTKWVFKSDKYSFVLTGVILNSILFRHMLMFFLAFLWVSIHGSQLRVSFVSRSIACWSYIKTSPLSTVLSYLSGTVL